MLLDTLETGCIENNNEIKENKLENYREKNQS
jgi:hypothetical protein